MLYRLMSWHHREDHLARDFIYKVSRSCLPYECMPISCIVSTSTHCGLVTPYGDIYLGQYWLGAVKAQAMACCLMAPSHYMNQCWLIIKGVLWHSFGFKFIRGAHELNPWLVFGDYTFEIKNTSPKANQFKSYTIYQFLFNYHPNNAGCKELIWRSILSLFLVT